MRGVYHVLTTPFHANGDLDEEGLRRLVAAARDAEVDGLTALGVTGEAHKLSGGEERQVLEIVREVAPGVSLCVGASRNGTQTAIEAVAAAAAAGAEYAMVAPPTMLKPGPGLTGHFREIAEASSIPVVLQDFPDVNGVFMTVRDMLEIIEAAPSIAAIKLEQRPTGRRTAEVRAVSEVPVLGGLGGAFLFEELEAGSNGTMTGFPFPGVLVDLWAAWDRGDEDEAFAIYRRYLPAMVADGTPGLGLAFRKEALVQRGLIGSALIRQPGPALSEAERAAAGRLLRRLDLI